MSFCGNDTEIWGKDHFLYSVWERKNSLGKDIDATVKKDEKDEKVSDKSWD